MADINAKQPIKLPVDASTQTTLAEIKAKTDNLDVLLSSRTKPADTQPISGTVQPGNTANTTPWLLKTPDNTRSDTYTGTANGVTVTVTTAPVDSFGIQVKGTDGSATTWDIRLEG